MREQKQNYFFDAVILVAALLMLYPIFWLLFSAFKPSSDIFRTATELIPRSWTLENFTKGFEGIAGIPFIRYIFNSLQIALISMVGAVCSSAVISYGFGRIPFKGKAFGLLVSWSR